MAWPNKFHKNILNISNNVNLWSNIGNLGKVSQDLASVGQHDLRMHAFKELAE